MIERSFFKLGCFNHALLVNTAGVQTSRWDWSMSPGVTDSSLLFLQSSSISLMARLLVVLGSKVIQPDCYSNQALYMLDSWLQTSRPS